MDPRLDPGRLLLGLLTANEPRRDDAESTESRRCDSKPRVAPLESSARQDSQYRDWKFSTRTAWVLVLSATALKDLTRRPTRRMRLHSHRSAVWVLSRVSLDSVKAISRNSHSPSRPKCRPQDAVMQVPEDISETCRAFPSGSDH